VLQLDVIWTAEFAAAEWIASLDRFTPPVDRFFPASIAANRWRRSLYALPWFIDVGLLYWRTDLMTRPPDTLEALESIAIRARADKHVPFGFVWQGARYEGLITTFLEHLGAFGGRILDDDGRVVVDEAPAIRALTFMRDAIYASGTVPQAVLTWREEQARFAFQNGQAAFMRNWPYAWALLQDASQSSVAGRFDVAAMPAASGGAPTAALGGSVLAINAFSDRQPAAYELIAFLLEPQQMIERAEVVGQFPSRPDAYESPRLQAALKMAPSTIKQVIDRAVPRPATPVYTELSELLQIALHRALTRQEEPEAALREAAAAMRALLERVKLAPT
jgi:multiple sugar transport system substrate-binding protein